jgi:hypothetical protein
MKVKGTQSPLGSGGAEPLNPRDLRKAVRGNFAEALSGLEAGGEPQAATQASGADGVNTVALEQIARGADLTSAEDAQRAVRESARLLISSRLGPGHRTTEQGVELVESLSEYVAADPLLKTKLLNILKKLQAV